MLFLSKCSIGLVVNFRFYCLLTPSWVLIAGVRIVQSQSSMGASYPAYLWRLISMTALIRPHLDYACVIWNPYQLGDIRILERVQRSATPACSSLRHLPYNDRLVALNLSFLMYRRRRMDMIMVYKILHGFGWNTF